MSIPCKGAVITHESSRLPRVNCRNNYGRRASTVHADCRWKDGIFVPDAWSARNGAIDAIVHFYGWRHDISATFSTYRLREQLLHSKRNAVLIVPEGPTNAPDSGAFDLLKS